MREAVICLLALLPVAATAAPAPMKPATPETFAMALEKNPRLPVWIWAAGQQAARTDTSLPLLAVGRIPGAIKPARIDDDVSGWQRPLPVLEAGSLLEKYWKGQMVPGEPTHQDAVTLFLVGPSLNSGEAWGPARLTREGKTFTLLLESWTDDRPRLRNVPSRALYAVHLGTLPASTYDLQVVWRTMHSEVNKTAPLYRLQAIKTGQLRFSVSRALTVIAPKPGEGLGHLSTLKESDFHVREVPAEEGKRLWQKPIHYVRSLSTEGAFNALPASGLYASTFDLPQWLSRKPKDLGQLPPLRAPVLKQETHAVLLGPTLNTGEWLTLREIEWRDRQAILRVDLWRDNGARLQNQRSCPVLVAPLRDWAAVLPEGDYVLQVEWTFLRAATNQEPYQPEDVTKGDAATWAKAVLQRGKVEFSLK